MANLYDKASLVMIPSQYKDGNLYNIKPLKSSFEFERGSRATRINKDGLIETFNDEATNLVTYSEDFSQWTSEGGIDEALYSTTSPEGLTNATKLELTSTDGKSAYYISSLTGEHTFSVFAKKGNHDVLYLWIGRTSSNITRWIDLENGVQVSENVGSSGDGDLVIEDFGNDWFRISLTFDATDMTRVNLEVADSGQSTGQIGDSIYVYGAQLEQGSYATSYIPTNGQAETRLNEDLSPIDMTSTSSDSYSIYLDYQDVKRGTPNMANFMYLYNQSNQILTYMYGRSLMIHSASGEDFTTFNFEDGKVAFVYDGTNVKYFLNGTLVKTITASTRWDVAPRDYWLRSAPFADSNSTINYNQVAVFNTALSDQECINLTTI